MEREREMHPCVISFSPSSPGDGDVEGNKEERGREGQWQGDGRGERGRELLRKKRIVNFGS